jgi:hypothetical protein
MPDPITNSMGTVRTVGNTKHNETLNGNLDNHMRESAGILTTPTRLKETPSGNKLKIIVAFIMR